MEDSIDSKVFFFTENIARNIENNEFRKGLNVLDLFNISNEIIPNIEFHNIVVFR